MFNKISFLEKVFFVKNLATMLKAGLSLREGVAVIQEQTDSVFFKKILSNIITSLDNGHTLADSLSFYPRNFNQLIVNIIKVGETSGTLEENLKYLSFQLEKSYELRRKIKGALIYPALILVSTFVLGTTLAVFILPKLIPLFKSFSINLPLPTKILMWFTDMMQSYGPFILLGVAILIVFFILLSRLPKIKKLLHKILLRLPIFGRISRSSNLADFSRTLGILLKSGVPIVQSLDVTAGTMKNMVYQEALRITSNKIQRGELISDYLKSKKFLFPPTVSRMIQVGERTGNLEQTLFHLAEFYEKEVDNVAKNLSNILEPFLLVVIGLVVGFIAIAIILPIYKLTGSFH